MRCPSCGYFLPVEWVYTACPLCGKPFDWREMVGENGLINRIYEAGKTEWRRDIAAIAVTSDKPHWFCQRCGRTYGDDVPKPADLICPTCRKEATEN